MYTREIPVKLKKQCADMKRAGTPLREIYKFYCTENPDQPQSFESFRRAILRWCSHTYPDDVTLRAGTYKGFVAHDATVRVSADGTITEAWIKQKVTDFDVEGFMQGLKGEVEPFVREKTIQNGDRTGMLEIPLFDMHWGIMKSEDYQPVLERIIDIIRGHDWDQIVIPIGQDLFHNDSLEHGITSNGTSIEKVDTETAVRQARAFFCTIIEEALLNSNSTRVIYTPGNHDRTMSWMFVLALKERFGSDAVDDEFRFRKCVTYGKNAIMLTHGDSKRGTAANLASIFPVAFPVEFSGAKTREIHAGHLHHEGEADHFGVMVRRLSTRVEADYWTDMNDYVGAMRRFMLFGWAQEGLRAIYYV